MWGFEGVEHEDTGNGVKFDAELAKLDDTYLVGKIKAKAHPFVEYFKFLKQFEDENTVAKYTIPAPAQTFQQFIVPNNIEGTRKFYADNDELIKDIATKESVIIVGRCSDYILREQSNVIRVFFYSDIETRIQVAIQNHGIKAKKARKYVEMQDQKRSGFYEFYTQQTWGDPSNYDLMINTTHISIPEAIALLSAVYQAKAR